MNTNGILNPTCNANNLQCNGLYLLIKAYLLQNCRLLEPQVTPKHTAPSNHEHCYPPSFTSQGHKSSILFSHQKVLCSAACSADVLRPDCLVFILLSIPSLPTDRTLSHDA